MRRIARHLGRAAVIGSEPQRPPPAKPHGVHSCNIWTLETRLCCINMFLSRTPGRSLRYHCSALHPGARPTPQVPKHGLNLNLENSSVAIRFDRAVSYTILATIIYRRPLLVRIYVALIPETRPFHASRRNTASGLYHHLFFHASTW